MSAFNEDRTTWGRALGEVETDTTLYLVRHGETKWNVEGRVQGHQHAPFSDRGWDQTRRIAHRLANTKFEAVYSSDLQRAYEAAELVAASHQLQAKKFAALRERSFGVLEGKTLDEAAKTQGSWLIGWQADRLLKSPPDGESQPEMCERVMEALRKIIIAHPGKSVAVVTHGGPIKSAVYEILRIPISLWSLTFIGNGSITILRGTQDVMRVVTFNDCSHLEGAISLTEPQ